MKFVSVVQSQQVAWPTQRRFNREEWSKKAQEFGEDQTDHVLAEAGIWIADTLDAIRRDIADSCLWKLSFSDTAYHLLALCNHDFVIAQKRSLEAVIDSPVIPMTFVDEMFYQSFDQDLFGIKRFSSLLESGLEVADLGLRLAQQRRKSTSDADISDIRRAANYTIAYQMAEDIFHYILWLGWRMEKVNNSRAIIPTNVEEEIRWEASYRRFTQLTMEYAQLSFFLWRNSSLHRELWLEATKGSNKFDVKHKRGIIYVSFSGRDRVAPETPPSHFINETTAREAYSEPLLMQPLPALQGRTVLDLLRVHFLLGEITEQIVKQFSVDNDNKHAFENLLEFCPTILREPLVDALSRALRIPEKTISLLIDALTIDHSNVSSRNVWFHPLVAVNSRKGSGLLFAFLPLVAGNVYRSVDYWLSKFGLPIERRGELFEHQIVVELRRAAKQGGVQEHVIVKGPVQPMAEDGMSTEEIDLILLLHDLLVVGEAKCQKLPVTPVERKNYMDTLRGATSQAARKAEWVTSNLSVVARELGVEVDQLSGAVEAIVITNHSPGVGFNNEGIFVLDLLLLKNFLSRPYQSAAIFATEHFIEKKGPRFYDTPEGMAKSFPVFVQSLPPIQSYLDLLRLDIVDFPIRKDERVGMLSFVMDHTVVAGKPLGDFGHKARPNPRMQPTA